jgi:hypothetical protein
MKGTTSHEHHDNTEAARLRAAVGEKRSTFGFAGVLATIDNPARVRRDSVTRLEEADGYRAADVARLHPACRFPPLRIRR